MQVNGWELFAHLLLLDQLEKLVAAVEKEKKGADCEGTAKFKLLAAVYELMFVAIPADPTRPEYRQGDTLGDDYKHWFRVKFGGQRFRLFFRYDSKAKVIVYAWVNDDDSKRTYGSKTDAYAVFKKMLDKGNPPDDWGVLPRCGSARASRLEAPPFVEQRGSRAFGHPGCGVSTSDNGARLSPTLAGALVAALLAAEPSVVAPPEPVAPPRAPDSRLVLNSLTILRYNPLGLEEQVRLGYQRRLYDSDSSVARENFVFLGIAPKLNPAYVKLAPSIEVQPLSVVNVKLTAEYVNFFSTFGYLQSLPSPGADYADSTMAAVRDAKLNYATSGAHVFGEVLLQAKVGKVALRNRFGLEYWNMAVKAGDSVWYDATLDTLVPRNGFVISDDADALYLAGHGLTLGLRYSWVVPFYDAADFQSGGATDAPNGHHRVGPLVAYTFYDDGFTRFAKPTVLLIANWYVAHRWRTGADVSRALPYLVLGFAFQSDFLGPGGLASARL